MSCESRLCCCTISVGEKSARSASNRDVDMLSGVPRYPGRAHHPICNAAASNGSATHVWKNLSRSRTSIRRRSCSETWTAGPVALPAVGRPKLNLHIFLWKLFVGLVLRLWNVCRRGPKAGCAGISPWLNPPSRGRGVLLCSSFWNHQASMAMQQWWEIRVILYLC